MSKIELHSFENENESQQLWRLGKAKDDGILDITWDEITDILNSDWHTDEEGRTKKTYKNKFTQAKQFYLDNIFGKVSDDSDLIKELRDEKYEIQKAKQKLYDERRDLNAKLRTTARHEEDIDRICNIFKTIGKERFFNPVVNDVGGNKTMVVCLSDLHVGAQWEHRTGSYSSSIAKERLEQYCGKIIEIANDCGIRNCIVVFCGDGISGNIHKSISVTNKENVVEQTKLVCEYISDFVYELSKVFYNVEFHSVSGNHSRLDKKEDALTDERLDALIPWFLKNMFMHIDNINIVDDELDGTMCSFSIGESKYVSVHGDFDGINDAAISKLCMWVEYKPYCVILGHKHYHAMSDVAGVKVVQSGSLCGTGDQFTIEKRLTSLPSQTVLVCNSKGRIESVYPVELV